MKSKKRRDRLAKKRAAKAKRFKLNADGSKTSNSRYARKQRGEVPRTPRVRPVWCSECYCRLCVCRDRMPPGEVTA